MRVLVCGHTSFAAQGIVEALQAAGHEPTCFGRGPVAAHDGIVTGSVDQLHANPHLPGGFDAVVNYILLKDLDIAQNVAYVDSLMQFCAGKNVKHLVHFSSVSSYKTSVKLIHEEAALEDDPAAKGSYGSLKVASDLEVLRRLPANVKLTMLRPGFIFGSGLVDPIVGTGVRLPHNRLLTIGNAKATFPVTSRELVHQAVLKVLKNPPASQRESLLLVAPNSPTRRDYLDAVVRRLGAGLGQRDFAVWMWWTLAIGAEIAARLVGQGKLKPFKKISGKLYDQRFDSSKTHARLGFDLSVDWPKELSASLDQQELNFRFPYAPRHSSPAFAMRSVAFLGYGRIVRQKHLPALKRLGFGGKIDAYDLAARKAEDGQEVRSIDSPIQEADLYVIASPGSGYVETARRLSGVTGRILIEKPLCHNESELRDFLQLSTARPDPVMVCHNYRYKENVTRMIRMLRRYNPGHLHHVEVDFQSSPASNDSAAWLRNERKTRTLLLDYSLHFLDLACMMARSPWSIDQLRHELNQRGQTGLIQGTVRSDYTVSFLLRQGFAPRRARLRFSFRNYAVTLGFFPETMVAHFSHDNAYLYGLEKKEIARAARVKILDKLFDGDSDVSHAEVFAAAGSGDPERLEPLRLERVADFYDLMFRMARNVYEPAVNA